MTDQAGGVVTPLCDLAVVALAAAAHDGQHDKSGAPYILHPIRVALRLHTDFERWTALLHDVVEDTALTLDDLAHYGVPDVVLCAVDALTKRPGETLRASMLRVKEAGDLACRVKYADIADNTNPERLALLDPETAVRLERKYQRSAEFLGTTVTEIRELFASR